MRAIFIRHGLAESNQEIMDRKVGEYADLTDIGREDIKETAELLLGRIAVNEIHSSPYPRTVQSAEALAEKLELKVVVEDRLREINKGEWEGLSVKRVIELEAAIDIDERHTFRPPGGENWIDVGERVAAFVEEQRLAGSNELLMMSHNHPILLGVGRLLKKPVVAWEDEPIDNASIIILDETNGVWEKATY